MDIRRFCREPLSQVRGWLDFHTDFIATRLTLIIAIVFCLLTVYYLAKSLGAL